MARSRIKLLIVRHGRADDRAEWAETGALDDLRPLTAEGAEMMRTGAIGLKSIVQSIDVLASSPLVRAQQTARIIADVYGIAQVVEVNVLRSDAAPGKLYEWLCGMDGKKVVAVVGHNTHLEELASWLLTGDKDPIVKIKKGAALMIELTLSHERGRPEEATLLWALTPAQLRGLACASSTDA